MSQSKSLVTNIAHAVCGFAAILTFFTFTLGLPWQTSGMWRQTEVASAALYAVSGVILLMLLVLAIAKDEVLLSVLKSKQMLLFAGFCLLGFLLMPFSDSPQRSLHGTMKHGAGVLWYFEVLLVAIALRVMLERGWSTVVMWTAFAGSFVIALSYGPLKTYIGVPVAFAEWAGMATGLVGLALLLERERISDINLRHLVNGFAVFLIWYGYYVSDNRTVALCSVVAAAFYLFWRAPKLATILDRGWVRGAIVTAITLIGMIAVYSAAPVIEKVTLSSAPPAKSATVLSNQPLDKYAFEAGTVGTIWSRSYLVRVQVNDLIANPVRFLTGNGWGGFEDAYERNARDLPGRTFIDNLPSASRTYWDGHFKANFHSHNMGVEVLYSVGIFGLALWLAMFAVMASTSKKGFYIALAFAVYGSFWFPLNHATGFIALAMALPVTLSPIGARAKVLVSGLAPLGFVFAIAFIVLAGLFAKIIQVETYERSFQAALPDSNPATCGLYRTSIFAENEITWALYTLLNRRVLSKPDPAQAVYDHTTSFVNLTCMMRRYSLENPDAVTLALSLKTRGQLVQLGNKTFGALTQDIVNWGQDIDKFLTVAPKRTEFLAPYLNLLAQRSPSRAGEEIDRYLPRLDETDPVREYLLYMKAQIANDPVAMKNHMQKAVDLGFANLWKVTPEMIKEFDLK